MNDPCITWVVLVLSWNLSQTLNARLVQYLNFCFLRVLGKQREDSFARYTYSHRHLLSSLHSRRREGIGRKGKRERLSRFSPSPLPLLFLHLPCRLFTQWNFSLVCELQKRTMGIHCNNLPKVTVFPHRPESLL